MLKWAGAEQSGMAAAAAAETEGGGGWSLQSGGGKEESLRDVEMDMFDTDRSCILHRPPLLLKP